MKKIFTKGEKLSDMTFSEITRLFKDNKENVEIKEYLNSDVDLTEKTRLVFNNCNLTLLEKQKLSLNLLWVVLPIFEDRYPEDKCVRLCLEAAENYLNSEVSEDKLKEIRLNVYDKALAVYTSADYNTSHIVYAIYSFAKNTVATGTDDNTWDTCWDDVLPAVWAASGIMSDDTLREYQLKFLNTMISFFEEN